MLVKMINPNGVRVSVSEEMAEQLKTRGYTLPGGPLPTAEENTPRRRGRPRKAADG